MHISPDDKRLQYCGRIDFDDPKAPVLVYAASFVQIRFTGTEISVTLANKRAYWSSRMGYILDGKQGQFLLTSDSDAKTYVIAEKVGYSDPNYFSYAFKKQFGMSPSKYKAEKRK